MKLFRIGIVVAMMLLCIPRKVQAYENTICSITHFHCIIGNIKNLCYIQEKDESLLWNKLYLQQKTMEK